MLKLKLQYFGHLMRRADSWEMTLMLGKIEGKKKRGWQRMKWLEGIINSMGMSFSKLQEIVKDREAWHAAIHGVAKTLAQLMAPTPVLLPGKSHGQRGLVGCSPWGRKESGTTERLHFLFSALEKEMATHSSVLAWRIPGTGEPGELPSMGLHRVGHDWSDLAAAAAQLSSWTTTSWDPRDAMLTDLSREPTAFPRWWEGHHLPLQRLFSLTEY